MDKKTITDNFATIQVQENSYTCSLDSKSVSSRSQDMSATYPTGFFDLFGAVPDLQIEEPEELSFDLDAKREPLS